MRGGLIDLYPDGRRSCRIGSTCSATRSTSIRTFDPDTQRSLYPIERVRLLPGREFPTDEAARTAFRGRWRERFEGDPSRTRRSIATWATASLAPASSTGCRFSSTPPRRCSTTCPAQSMILTHGDVDEAAAHRFTLDTTQRHKFLAHDAERPLLRPDELFITAERFFTDCAGFARWSLARAPEAPAPEAPATGRAALATALPDLSVNRRAQRPLEALDSYLRDTAHRTLIVAESPGRRETLAQLFAEYDLLEAAADGCRRSTDWRAFARGSDVIALGVAPLHDGFELPDAGLAVITEAELFAGVVAAQRARPSRTQTDVDAIIRDLSELKIGDPVVHAQHGIGRYEGLRSLDLGDGDTEFLHLSYAEPARRCTCRSRNCT